MLKPSRAKGQCLQTSLRFFMFALITSFAVGAVGCTADFDAKSLVNKPRILAVKASNPRMNVNEFTDLTALVVAEPDEEYTLKWELCAFTGSAEDGFPCEFPPETPPELLALLTGEGTSFSFFYAEPLQKFVDTFCGKQEEIAEQLPPGIPLPNCNQGYPFNVRLTATFAEEEIAAVKTLHLLPSPEILEPTANTNPRISSLETVGPADLSGEHPAVELRCELDTDSLDLFTRPDDLEERKEEILYSWYVANAELDKDLSFFSPESDPDEAQRNTVLLTEGGPARVWCVIRDGRGGIDWREIAVPVP